MNFDLGSCALFDESLDRLEAFPPAEDVSHSPTPSLASQAPFDRLSKVPSELDAANAHISDLQRTLNERSRLLSIYQKRDSITLSSYPDLPADIKARLSALKNDKTRLNAENARLKTIAREIERETIVQREETAGQSKKLKGAIKKVGKAKGIADKEKQGAKQAVDNKIQHLKSERNMRQEKNHAVREAQALEKKVNDLEATLDVERSGRAHLREDGTESDYTTVVTPIEFKIDRTDFHKLGQVWEWNRLKLHDHLSSWYEHWKKPKEGESADEERKKHVFIGPEAWKKSSEIASDGFDKDGYMMTGAEHDGWRSKKGLEAICAHSMAVHSQGEY